MEFDTCEFYENLRTRAELGDSYNYFECAYRSASTYYCYFYTENDINNNNFLNFPYKTDSFFYTDPFIGWAYNPYNDSNAQFLDRKVSTNYTLNDLKRDFGHNNYITNIYTQDEVDSFYFNKALSCKTEEQPTTTTPIDYTNVQLDPNQLNQVVMPLALISSMILACMITYFIKSIIQNFRKENK